LERDRAVYPMPSVPMLSINLHKELPWMMMIG
jgi:hypothetical protein